MSMKLSIRYDFASPSREEMDEVIQKISEVLQELREERRKLFPETDGAKLPAASFSAIPTYTAATSTGLPKWTAEWHIEPVKVKKAKPTVTATTVKATKKTHRAPKKKAK